MSVAQAALLVLAKAGIGPSRIPAALVTLCAWAGASEIRLVTGQDGAACCWAGLMDARALENRETPDAAVDSVEQRPPP